METLDQEGLDIQTLIEKGLCKTIVVKGTCQGKVQRMINGGLQHDEVDSERI